MPVSQFWATALSWVHLTPRRNLCLDVTALSPSPPMVALSTGPPGMEEEFAHPFIPGQTTCPSSQMSTAAEHRRHVGGWDTDQGPRRSLEEGSAERGQSRAPATTTPHVQDPHIHPYRQAKIPNGAAPPRAHASDLAGPSPNRGVLPAPKLLPTSPRRTLGLPGRTHAGATRGAPGLPDSTAQWVQVTWLALGQILQTCPSAGTSSEGGVGGWQEAGGRRAPSPEQQAPDDAHRGATPPAPSRPGTCGETAAVAGAAVPSRETASGTAGGDGETPAPPELRRGHRPPARRCPLRPRLAARGAGRPGVPARGRVAAICKAALTSLSCSISLRMAS